MMAQAALGRELGISKSYLSMILSGQRKRSEKLVKRSCKIYGDSEAEMAILSHARLPVPTLCHDRNALSFYRMVPRKAGEG